MTTQSEPGDGRLDPSLSAIMSERRQLINLAYRLLGSLAEAEDVVQETYARWYAMSQQQQEAIESLGGWLTKVASRICLDLLGSARARRERYVGEWIPEPLPDRTEWTTGWSGGTTVDPADRGTLDESINMAFLVVLESMTPAERVAFILHDVFRYSFAEVAEIVGVAAADGDGDALLALAAGVEADSEHPLARAIVGAARERDLTPRPAHNLRSMTGRGVEATVDGHDVAVGGPTLLRERGLRVPAELQDDIERWKQRGAAVLHVVRDGGILGSLALEDQVRPESRAAIDALHRLGVKVAMITGDAQQVADAVAADLGIDEVFAEVLPEDKDSAVSDLQGRGHTVAMVGDGVNDAPALARADVGIAIGAGTDVAIESAGIVLASDDPRAVVAVKRLSAASYRKMVQNLWWAAGYNLAAIPLAAGVLAWAGFVLPMAVGAVLMSLSTVVVALNAQLLRRVDLRPQAAQKP